METASFEVQQEQPGYLSRLSSEIDPHLETRRENRGFSRVVAGPTVFLSSGDVYVRELLELP